MKRTPDLNLLLGLDALLSETSVTGAASRLELSVPAMSHMLARIRREFNDPILVRSGRRMVPTPRALEMKGRVSRLIEEAMVIQADAAHLDPETIRRDILVVAGEASISFLGGPFVAYLRKQAPNVRVGFTSENLDLALRNYAVTLAIGPRPAEVSDVRSELLFEDRIVGVCRPGHPLLEGPVSQERYLAAEHLINARGGRMVSPLDALLGAQRHARVSAPTVSSLWILLQTDLVGLCYQHQEKAAVEALGLETFELPYPLAPVAICQSWLSAHDLDPVHRWLRKTLHQVVADLPFT